MVKKKQTKKEMESVCCEALSLSFFTPVTHVLLKGRSPDAGRQLDGAGLAFCMRSSPCAGGCWRAIGEVSLLTSAEINAPFCYCFLTKKDGYDSPYCDYIY